MDNTCFVIMPIGTQTIGNVTIKEEELREKYDFIIKEAIMKANPKLEVIRADEELNPSSISNDIFMKLMHSRFVIADITFPNPNVFYELGIRHAIKNGTILIRENVDFNIPFDISHLRHIEYTQEPSGMNKLATQLERMFKFYEQNPNKPDNQFLELCSYTNYIPTVFNKTDSNKQKMTADILKIFITNPKMMKILTDSSLSPKEQQQIFMKELGRNPDNAQKFIETLLEAGLIKF